MSIRATEEKHIAISSPAVYIEITIDAVPRSDHGGSMPSTLLCTPRFAAVQRREARNPLMMRPRSLRARHRRPLPSTLVFIMMGLRAVAAGSLVMNESLMF